MRIFAVKVIRIAKSSNFLQFFNFLEKGQQSQLFDAIFLVQAPQNNHKDQRTLIENLFLYKIQRFVSMKNKMLSRNQAHCKAWSFRVFHFINFSDIIILHGLCNMPLSIKAPSRFYNGGKNSSMQKSKRLLRPTSLLKNTFCCWCWSKIS